MGPESISFGYYKNNQDTFLILGLVIYFFMELGILYVLMLQFWAEWAWTFFWFGVATIIYMIGLWASFKRNPIEFYQGKFYFHWGLNSSQMVNLNDIKSLNTGQFKDPKDGILALKYMAVPNVEIIFK